MGKGFNPSKADTDTFFNVMDTNKDGRVTLQDLEALAIKYLAGVNPIWEKQHLLSNMNKLFRMFLCYQVKLDAYCFINLNFVIELKNIMIDLIIVYEDK